MTEIRVKDNLAAVRERMDAACAQAGRSSASVRLVAVSKRIDSALVAEAVAAGQYLLGENRVDDALARQDQFSQVLLEQGLTPPEITWHFIGHLQRNKAQRAAGRFDLLHGVDSLALAEKLSRLALADSRREPLLLEINVAGEAQKHGLALDQAPDLIEAIAALPGLHVQGLMTMAPYQAPESVLHATFAGLRRLCEEARRRTGLPLPELSMGKSGDFEVAIAEGATLVRVGSAIFGSRS